MEQKTLQQVFSKVKDIKLRVDFLDSLTSESLRRKAEKEFKGDRLIYDELVSLLDTIEGVLNIIEEEDANLNPDITKLEPVGKHFEGNPVNDYINRELEKAYDRLNDSDKMELIKIEPYHSLDSFKEYYKKEIDEKTRDIYKKVVRFDKHYQEEKNKLMDEVEKHLDTKSKHLTFSSLGLELIKFYLLNLDNVDQEEIRGLTEDGLKLAWRRRSMNKGRV